MIDSQRSEWVSAGRITVRVPFFTLLQPERNSGIRLITSFYGAWLMGDDQRVRLVPRSGGGAPEVGLRVGVESAQYTFLHSAPLVVCVFVCLCVCVFVCPCALFQSSYKAIAKIAKSDLMSYNMSYILCLYLMFGILCLPYCICLYLVSYVFHIAFVLMFVLISNCPNLVRPGFELNASRDRVPS